MKKGFEVVQLVGAVMILIITAFLTWGFIGGRSVSASKTEYEEGKQTLTQSCSIDRDCIDNPNGIKCYQIFDPNHPGDFTSFCGCIKNEDCKLGGTCGPDNRCS